MPISGLSVTVPDFNVLIETQAISFVFFCWNCLCACCYQIQWGAPFAPISSKFAFCIFLISSREGWQDHFCFHLSFCLVVLEQLLYTIVMIAFLFILPSVGWFCLLLNCRLSIKSSVIALLIVMALACCYNVFTGRSSEPGKHSNSTLFPVFFFVLLKCTILECVLNHLIAWGKRERWEKLRRHLYNKELFSDSLCTFAEIVIGHILNLIKRIKLLIVGGAVGWISLSGSYT